MGFLDKIFGKKKENTEAKEETETQEKEQEKIPEKKEVTTSKDTEGYYICENCGFHIIPEKHGQKTFDGKKFHKKCFRKLKKGVKNQAFG
ncbi:MAG TPA: hypothetical protein VJ912_02200 [Candidatus Nanoarchaeia archaeon]|nr:hypothetical protein [Candidatus Nanoarchaeia archaeon]